MAADRRRRGTPISDSLGADLQALGGILASHTRGLDAYLNRQAQRIDQRHHNLLAEPPAVLLPPDLQLDRLSKPELQALCRQHRLRGCCCCSSISLAWTQRWCRPPGGGMTAGAGERRLAMRRPTRWQANESAHYDS